MKRLRRLAVSAALLSAGTMLAQTPPPPDTTTATPASPPTWSAGPIDFSGLVDGYYSYNFNHPASRNNVIRNFDVKSNQPTLNFAKLTMEHAPDPVGFKFEAGFGRAMEVFHATEPGGVEVYKHIFQAYVSVKPPKWKGVQIDFGKFVTSAGAEVTETHLNWNYSRALLYANGPYYHFGMRTTIPVGAHFTGGFQLINGWNNVEDNNNAKTVGLTAAFTSSKISWFNNYYVGNEKTDTVGGIKIEAPGLRHFYDTVVAVNPSSQVNFLFNFDYGTDKRALAADADAVFYGTSLAMRYMPNAKFAFSPRWDWYKDRDGFITGGAKTLQEFTLTADYRMLEGFLSRFEYRRDWSDQPFFDRGNQTGNYKSQSTLLVGLIVYFGPKR